VVFLPNQTNIGISKKIYSHSERRRLKKISNQYLPENCGTIIRTAAMGQKDSAIANDYKFLLKLWDKIQLEAKNVPVRTRLHKDMDMVDAIIRDHFKEDVERVYIDSRKIWREIKSYLKEFSPEMLEKLEYFHEKTPIFDHFGIENELQKALDKKVWLKAGGYLIIEQTEALISIDVNSGRFMGKEDHESNSLKINLEAAVEIARQLRLRDLGGIIIVDFIDVENDKNKLKIYNELTKYLKRDRAITKVLEMSKFGLIEMTRQRIRPGVIHKFYETCPVCHGVGLVPTVNNTIAKIERWVRRYRASGGDLRLVMQVHPEVADYLLKGFFNKRYQLMLKYFVVLKIEVNEKLLKHQFRVFLKKSGEDITNQIKA
jgi:ribonuclease G